MNMAKVEILKIMRSSKLFQPVNIMPKTNYDAGSISSPVMSKSQKLLIDMGIIRQSSTGIYHLLPLGVRSMNKLKTIVHKYIMNNIESQEIKMPFIVDGLLWKKSGRWEEAEIFKFKDRHENDRLLSPTNEESAADLVAGLGQLSHKQLPIVLYQIATKFRDEIKPRCGLLKTKEFEMMDAYSFDVNIECSRSTYGRMSTIFENIFNHLEIPFTRVLADPGNMGGELSHEYHLLTDVGEDQLHLCKECNRAVSAATSAKSCPSCGNTSFKQVKGIEVGHTFLLGTRYSLPLGCNYTNKDGKPQPVIMGSYGLGLSRLIAASLELLSSDEEITWPANLAPFSVCVIPPKEGSKEWDRGSVLSLDVCKELEKILPEDVLLDDRCDQTIGKRLRHARRTGYPYIICIGKGAAESSPVIELISTQNNSAELLTMNDLIRYFAEFQQQNGRLRSVF